ncbi:hypothetical protein FACS1894182_12130 [Bacteroidia bacterium]|nr:hypothetical protein FACS1894182_12130 [Bacteroidia bacterium]
MMNNSFVMAGLTRHPLNNVNKYLTSGKRWRINSVLTVLLLAMPLFPIYAQEKNPDLQRELTLEKEYTPSLRDANKLNSVPEIKEPEAPKTKVEYSNYTLDYPLSPYFRKLGAINYFPGFADSDKRGYLTFGISSLLNIDGDAGYQILQSETDRLSIFASHRSSNSDVKYLQSDGKGKMKINDNLLGVDFKHHFEKATLSADAQYTHSNFNYYGFPTVFQVYTFAPDDYLPPYNLSINQSDNLLKTHIGVAAAENQTLNYQLNVRYTLFKQKQADIIELAGRTENRILLDGGLYTHINATTGIGMEGAVKNYSYESPDDSRYNSLTDEALERMREIMGNYNYTTFMVNPYLTFEGDNWDARLGVKGSIQFGGITKFVPAPDIHFRWRPSDPFLLYLTAEGGIKDNSAYNMYYENRYIHPLYRIYDSKSPLDGTLGIVFSPAVNLSVDLFTGYKWVKDEHFYFGESYNSYQMSELSVMGQKILPQYADAEIFKLGGSIKYQYQDKFDLNLKLVYNHWNVTKIPEEINTNPFSELVAWNKPVFTGEWNMGFKIPSLPLRMDLNYHLETGRKALYGMYETVNMKDIHDVNVAATYSINESLSIFAKANNLLFQKYDLWQGYPAQGFNVMVGANLKF